MEKHIPYMEHVGSDNRDVYDNKNGGIVRILPVSAVPKYD